MTLSFACHATLLTLRGYLRGLAGGKIQILCVERHWAKGRYADYVRQVRETTPCVVCSTSSVGLHALACNLGASDPEVQMATIGVQTHGPQLVAFFFHLVYGGAFSFTGQGKELCHAHYQHFLTQPPSTFLSQLEVTGGKPWVGWSARQCAICTFGPTERPHGWQLCGGLTTPDRNSIITSLIEDECAAKQTELALEVDLLPRSPLALSPRLRDWHTLIGSAVCVGASTTAKVPFTLGWLRPVPEFQDPGPVMLVGRRSWTLSNWSCYRLRPNEPTRTAYK